MNIEYIHASKYGNGVRVAEEFSKQMAATGATVNVHHVKKVDPKKLPAADLYLFSSPGRFGKPIGEMQRALKKLQLADGTKYAVITTEVRPQDDKGAKDSAAEGEAGQGQRVIPVINEILKGKGLVELAEETVYVTGVKGPLEDGWQRKVEALTAKIAAA